MTPRGQVRVANRPTLLKPKSLVRWRLVTSKLTRASASGSNPKAKGPNLQHFSAYPNSKATNPLISWFIENQRVVSSCLAIAIVVHVFTVPKCNWTRKRLIGCNSREPGRCGPHSTLRALWFPQLGSINGQVPARSQGQVESRISPVTYLPSRAAPIISLPPSTHPGNSGRVHLYTLRCIVKGKLCITLQNGASSLSNPVSRTPTRHKVNHV